MKHCWHETDVPASDRKQRTCCNCGGKIEQSWRTKNVTLVPGHGKFHPDARDEMEIYWPESQQYLRMSPSDGETVECIRVTYDGECPKRA